MTHYLTHDGRMHNASQSADNDAAMIAWLVETLRYPFDFSFDTPPPVNHARLADYWNEHDDWGVSAEDARACVYEEAGIALIDGRETRVIPPGQETPDA